MRNQVYRSTRVLFLDGSHQDLGADLGARCRRDPGDHNLGSIGLQYLTNTSPVRNLKSIYPRVG